MGGKEVLMAGSLAHIVTDDGEFTMDLIENLGDAHEALEECLAVVKGVLGYFGEVQEVWIKDDGSDVKRAVPGIVVFSLLNGDIDGYLRAFHAGHYEDCDGVTFYVERRRVGKEEKGMIGEAMKNEKSPEIPNKVRQAAIKARGRIAPPQSIHTTLRHELLVVYGEFSTLVFEQQRASKGSLRFESDIYTSTNGENEYETQDVFATSPDSEALWDWIVDSLYHFSAWTGKPLEHEETEHFLSVAEQWVGERFASAHGAPGK